MQDDIIRGRFAAEQTDTLETGNPTVISPRRLRLVVTVAKRWARRLVTRLRALRLPKVCSNSTLVELKCGVCCGGDESVICAGCRKGLIEALERCRVFDEGAMCEQMTGDFFTTGEASCEFRTSRSLEVDDLQDAEVAEGSRESATEHGATPSGHLSIDPMNFMGTGETHAQRVDRTEVEPSEDITTNIEERGESVVSHELPVPDNSKEEEEVVVETVLTNVLVPPIGDVERGMLYGEQYKLRTITRDGSRWLNVVRRLLRSNAIEDRGYYDIKRIWSVELGKRELREGWPAKWKPHWRHWSWAVLQAIEVPVDMRELWKHQTLDVIESFCEKHPEYDVMYSELLEIRISALTLGVDSASLAALNARLKTWFIKYHAGPLKQWGLREFLVLLNLIRYEASKVASVGLQRPAMMFAPLDKLSRTGATSLGVLFRG